MLNDPDFYFRTLFEESPVLIWIEDLSELKNYLNFLKKENTDFRKYFDENPSEIAKCAQMVKVVDMNKSLMDLMEEESKAEALGPISKYHNHPYQITPFKEAVIELSKGNLQNLVEGYTTPRKGGAKIYLQFLTHIPQMYASTWEEAWVFVFDLTKWKALETKLKEMVHKNKFLLDLLTHDLRNYHLQSQGFLDLILRGEPREHEEVTKYLTTAKRGIQRATHLLENVS
ncbi:MAG: hypothetical protein ACFFDT_03045, partial [Candidatus Hodarchaeota archaeon]